MDFCIVFIFSLKFLCLDKLSLHVHWQSDTQTFCSPLLVRTRVITVTSATCLELTQVVLGAAYRAYIKLTSWMGVATKRCNHVTRGGNRHPITTCLGK